MVYGKIVDDYIIVDENNIHIEHICCAISNAPQQLKLANTKKIWLKERMKDGLVFLKMNVRGKVFIEYMPAENAFAPIDAPNYMYINCFWVAGAYGKQGAGSTLLNKCIEDAELKGRDGLVIISSAKKKPYLSDSKFLVKRGFKIADEGANEFLLYYLPFTEDKKIPKFNDSAKIAKISDDGMVIYYSNQCVFSKMVAELNREVAIKNGENLKIVEIETYQDAQKMCIPFTIFSFFDKGTLVSHIPMMEKDFQKYLDVRNNWND